MVSKAGTTALGFDGGGTKTDAVLADSAGRQLGVGRAGACNLAAVPLRSCLSAAFDAAAQALDDAGLVPEAVGAVCAGVAGVSFAPRAVAFHKSLEARFPNARVLVYPDYVTAFRGAHAGRSGVLVIAGTGSVAYGENEAGLSRKSGAYGYLIDDAGSGYGAGRGALAAVMRAADGTGEPTTLSERIMSALKLKHVSEIVPAVYGKKIDRVEIAALAEIAAVAANEDKDYVAASLLASAGGALARLTQAVLNELFSGVESPVPIASAGSLWNSGAYLLDAFQAILEQGPVPFEIVAAENTPVNGAVLSACRMLA